MAYKAILVEVIPRLWVGDEEAVPEANRRGYSILAACKDGSTDCHRAVLGYTSHAAPKDRNYYFVQKDKSHMALNLIDTEDAAFIPDTVVNAGMDFLREQYDSGKKVFSHCIAGHSRGPTMAMMFMRAIGELPHGFATSEKVFKTLYPHYSPNTGMRQYARERWAGLPTFFPKGK
jgi:predicted protein tyrosine phosphatase